MRSSISIATILLLSLALLSHVSAEKEQVLQGPLSSMLYGNVRVQISEDAKNPTSPDITKMYYYSPLTLLDHKSAKSGFNNVTKQAELRIRIEMWNDDVNNKVVEYLSQFLGHEVKPSQVKVRSFDKVMMANANPFPAVYTLSNDWIPYQMEKSIWFTLTCLQQKDCDQVEALTHQNPTDFEHFKFFFGDEISKTKLTNIRIISSGGMASKLLQRYPMEKDVYLTANDENKLVSELETNIFMESFGGFDMISPNSISEIRTVIRELIVESRTKVKDMEKQDLDKVYQKSKDHGKLDGEMLLSKINLEKLRGEQPIPDQLSVNVHYTTASMYNEISFRDLSQVANTDDDELAKLRASFAKSEKDRKDFEKKNRDEVQSINAQLSELKSKLGGGPKPDVSFLAFVSKYFNETENHVKYDKLEKNRGDGLSLTTGIFTAPKAGTYLFTFSAAVGPKECQFYFTLNGIEQEAVVKTQQTSQQLKLKFGSSSQIITLMVLNVNDNVGVYLKLGGVLGFDSANLASVRMYHRMSPASKNLKTFFSGQLLQ